MTALHICNHFPAEYIFLNQALFMPNSATRHLIINLIFITITQTLTLRTQLSKYAPLYDYFVSFLSTQKSPLGFQQSNFMNLIQIPKKKTKNCTNIYLLPWKGKS